MFSAKASTTFLFMVLTVKLTTAQQPAYCSQPAKTGPCRAHFTRYFYNTETGMCERFIYGGCQANDNNFKTMAICTSACVCSLPSSPGQKIRGRICRNSRRYFYDVVSGGCSTFIYKGCGGNRNNFRWKGFCNFACSNSSCFLPSETGPCKAAFKKFFYNHATGNCEEFIYGGCKGNGNNFDSIQECERTCDNS